jgi:phage terminase large subunit-like protein
MLPKAARQPTYKGLLAFCRAIEEPLGRWQQRIARVHFGAEREAAAILPRGNSKTTTAALIGLHHLITVPGAAVTIGAASAQQAKICFDRMKGFAAHENLRGLITSRTLELRADSLATISDDPMAQYVGRSQAILRVVPAVGERAHGLSSSLYIADELWAWREEAALLEAMQTGLIKRPDAKLLAISTAASRLDSPLGRLRARALAQKDVKRSGFVIEAHGELAWIEWSLPDSESLDNMESVKKVNPAPFIDLASLRRQRQSVPEIAFAQFHANRWGVQEGAWLPAGAWHECASEADIEPGETVWIGVDVGGSRANSAVVMVTEDLRVKAQTWLGDESVLEVAKHIETLARDFNIREVVYDPWRFRSEALRLEERGLPMVEFPQSHTRMVPASEKLYAAIVEKRLKHQNDSELNAHVASAVAKQTPRGWRLEKSAGGGNIDAAVALAMAVDRAEQPAEQTALLGWI